jgi:hypothetical protein
MSRLLLSLIHGFLTLALSLAILPPAAAAQTSGQPGGWLLNPELAGAHLC